jgi:hypothetical protein
VDKLSVRWPQQGCEDVRRVKIRENKKGREEGREGMGRERRREEERREEKRREEPCPAFITLCIVIHTSVKFNCN